jgi:hypothetical protein
VVAGYLRKPQDYELEGRSNKVLGFEARHVVPSSTNHRVLFGAFEHSVVIRDLVLGTQSAPFHTTFDFGGQRLALSDEVDGVLAGAYHIHGTALYSASTGREVWRRKDLRKVQRITLSRDGSAAYCGIEDSPLVEIDLRTGETRRKVRAARSLNDSPYDNVCFLDGSPPQLVDETGLRRFIVDRTTFGFLDVAFAPGLLCLSESGGPVRCIDLATGEEQWRYEPPLGSHVLCLGYRAEAPGFLGVEWPFEKGGAKRLLQVSLDGSILGTHNLREPRDCCFALAGPVVVTTEVTSLTQQQARRSRIPRADRAQSAF